MGNSDTRAGLRGELAVQLPEPLAVGGGTTLFLEGSCSHAEHRVTDLRLLVGDEEHPVIAHGMAAPGATGPGDWWWAFVELGTPERPEATPLGLRAKLANGQTADRRLAVLDLVRSEPPPMVDAPAFDEGEGSAPVAICMATYDPPIKLFKRQVESIRSQTHSNWTCVISDDASRPETLDSMREVIGDDARFAISASATRRGFFRNFERALRLCPPGAAYVALSDQDDEWYPDKLETLVQALGDGANLAYSDMRVVSGDGQVLAETFWTNRRNNDSNFTSICISNTVTGASLLFRAELLDAVLPFPPSIGRVYHDHWIAIVCMALGRLVYVDRPLYDYIQHRGAWIGHASANAADARTGISAWRHRFSRLRRRHWHPNWRRMYFSVYCAVQAYARTLEARHGSRLDRRRRRALKRVIDCDRGIFGWLWLTARSLRPWFGADETLGRERILWRAAAWRQVARLRSRRRRPRSAGAAHRPPALDDAPATGSGPAGDSPLIPLLVDHAGRDGSTLMMRLLSTSPEIALGDTYPFEDCDFTYLWQRSRLLYAEQWDRRQWRPAHIPRASQSMDDPIMGPTFDLAWREFSRRAVRETRSRSGRPDAEVRYYAQKHLLGSRLDLQELPPLRLLALVRDPRDVFVSILAFDERRGWPGFGREPGSSEEEYLQAFVLRQRERLQWLAALVEGEGVCVVRYEDLIADTTAVAGRIERWLDVELDPRAPAQDRELIDIHVTAPSPARSAGRWRDDLAPSLTRAIEDELGDEMTALGYPASLAEGQTG